MTIKRSLVIAAAALASALAVVAYAAAPRPAQAWLHDVAGQIIPAAYRTLHGYEWPVLRRLSADEPRGPVQRVSEGGFYYGDCEGVILAVLLWPEPCEAVWDEEWADEEPEDAALRGNGLGPNASLSGRKR